MKAISLHQPYASAIALGSKRVETRSWSTKYRGLLAIHAAKRCVVSELINIRFTFPWRGALSSTDLIRKDSKSIEYEQSLPFGAIVAICDLVDCRRTDDFTQRELDQERRSSLEPLEVCAWTERMMGDFSLGRYGWILENIRGLEHPIPCQGRQGFFVVPDSLFPQ